MKFNREDHELGDKYSLEQPFGFDLVDAVIIFGSILVVGIVFTVVLGEFTGITSFIFGTK